MTVVDAMQGLEERNFDLGMGIPDYGMGAAELFKSQRHFRGGAWKKE